MAPEVLRFVPDWGKSEADNTHEYKESIMNLPDVERFVTDLLARGDMNSDTTADLNRILAEARAGTADADDLDYLQALHARIFATGESVVEAVAPVDVDVDAMADLRAENERLRAELDAARNTIAELEERLSAQG